MAKIGALKTGKYIVFIFIFVFVFAAFQLPAAPNNAVKLVVTLLTGVAAANATANADEAKSVYQAKDEVVVNLKSQGIDPQNGAIFSVYFQLDKNADAIYWERWFGWPNVIVEVEIEGQGSFLLPEIGMSYQGQQMLENLIAKDAAPGARVVVHVLDDKQFENAIWNSILKTKFDYKITTDVTACQMLPIDCTVDGSFQLLNQNVEILQPVPLATAEFTVPYTTNGRWLATANFMDNNNNPVGVLQFAEIWQAPKNLNQVVANAHKNYILWVGIAVVFGAVFLKNLLSSSKS